MLLFIFFNYGFFSLPKAGRRQSHHVPFRPVSYFSLPKAAKGLRQRLYRRVRKKATGKEAFALRADALCRRPRGKATGKGFCRRLRAVGNVGFSCSVIILRLSCKEIGVEELPPVPTRMAKIHAGGRFGRVMRRRKSKCLHGMATEENKLWQGMEVTRICNVCGRFGGGRPGACAVPLPSCPGTLGGYEAGLATA